MTITEFDKICQLLCLEAGIAQDPVLVATEEEATNELKERAGIQLVSVIPTIEMEGSADNEKEVFVTILFVLEKAYGGQERQKKLDQYQRTQDAINKIKDFISDQQSEGCSPFKNYDVNQTVIDPKYHIFSDYNGWSMTLVF